MGFAAGVLTCVQRSCPLEAKEDAQAQELLATTTYRSAVACGRLPTSIVRGSDVLAQWVQVDASSGSPTPLGLSVA